MGKLYVISTPIGNLEDMTLRAKRLLGEIDLLACEDTRKTGLLLEKLKIANKPQLISYYEENELGRIPQIISFLKTGKDVGLVSNAGTPTISDPGFKLVRECVAQEIHVEAIPGPSAVLAALVSSGLPTDKFLYLGFLPPKQGKRKKLLENLLAMKQFNNLTILFYESPYRLLRTLEDIKNVFDNIEVVLCRELTKVHEEIRRETVSEAIDHFSEAKAQGEFTILFNIPFNLL